MFLPSMMDAVKGMLCSASVAGASL
uniref:Afamin n=1 Tax=Myotis myotis TaxID=51298 RepID=A0A7J8AH12_MYOMY|nr:afamin [Myotis myotis]